MPASFSTSARAAAKKSNPCLATAAYSALMVRCLVRPSSGAERLSAANSRAATPLSKHLSMHRGEESRQPETGQPCPHRLPAHAEVPGSDHRIGAPDQIVDGQ